MINIAIPEKLFQCKIVFLLLLTYAICMLHFAVTYGTLTIEEHITGVFPEHDR